MAITHAADGTRLYYEVLGSGDPLLLVNGQGGDHTGWDDVREDFADRYRVVVYDHRGTGASDAPHAPPYSTRGFAADAIAILDAVGVRRAHVYGTSMGGRIAQWLGADFPTRIGALVLGCTTPGDAHGVRRDERTGQVMLNGAADPREGLLQSYTPAYVDAHPELLSAPPRPIPEHARLLHYQASQAHDAWDVLPQITAPTLVIHGSDDIVNPTANAALLAERIPDARMHIVAGGRHAYFREFREESSRVVLDFLAAHPLEAEQG